MKKHCIACSQTGIFYTIKIPILSTDLVQSPQNPDFCFGVFFVLFLVETDKVILKFIQKCKRSRMGKIILETK